MESDHIPGKVGLNKLVLAGWLAGLNHHANIHKLVE